MRILAIDGSLVLPTLVRGMVPDGVEVDSASTFQEAERILSEELPDGVIVNLAPAKLPWDRLIGLCRRRGRPIPVLFESCVFSSLEDAGIEATESCAFLRKPYPLEELRQSVECLVRRAGEISGAAGVGS